jgi:hypothetical protein
MGNSDHDEIIGKADWIRHDNFNEIVCDNLGLDFTRCGFKTHISSAHGADFHGERRNAARAVSAKLGLGSVGIEKHHFKIADERLLKYNHAFTAHSDTPCRHHRDTPVIMNGKVRITVVDENKIIPGSVHFGEFDDIHHYVPQTQTKDFSKEYPSSSI